MRKQKEALAALAALENFEVETMKIIFYTTHCPKCKVVESKLKQKSVKYEECTDINIMQSKGLTFAPALEVDGVIYNFVEAVKFINTL